ncbi:response regulator [Paenibacillus athensensis]|uniref:Chemotaxis protein CheY n=1 Tax=Paenibacillus athensensis TaxID=1967502 RepID=A0A4Y8PYB6_9BACL|nr:response regulator [Paenibacillus athensensis]MCD1259645.1 response regulator [Paenibacillus athensensis]
MYSILIIDDEPWSRQVVKSLGAWTELGLTIAGEAEDGREGLELIAALAPQIVLTDMRMPGLDGIELLRELNERYPELKIIVMSGYDDFLYLKQAIRSRAVEYLLKPISPEELNAALALCVRELDARQAAADAAAGASPTGVVHLFADRDVLDAYVAFRQQLYEQALALNAEAAASVLRQLGALLQRHYGERPEDGHVPDRLAHDCIALLETWLAAEQADPGLLAAVRGRAAAGPWATIAEAVVGLERLFAETIAAVEAARRTKQRLDLTEVMAYIERHYADPISLESIALHFFISKEHLSRAFKAEFAQTVSDCITRKRMDKARELVADRQIPFKHIAQLVGYADPTYFYKVFKSYFGMTPGELRSRE